MKTYQPRIMDTLLARKLEGMGAVLIEGPKWCGKTTTAEQIAKSVLYMDDPKKRKSLLALAETDPGGLLEGSRPRLLDEWQRAPKLWDAVRFSVDHSDDWGQYILTGSSVPPQTDELFHTGTGRIARLSMRTMSLWESGESSGTVRLSELFETGGKVGSAVCPDRSLRETAFLVCRGGWPQAVRQKGDMALDRAFDYCDSIAGNDVSRVDPSIRSSERIRRLMASFARLQGSQAGLATIKKDLAANDVATLDETTVSIYLRALKRIFVVEDMPAWSPNLRSKTPIRTGDTRYFSDPSIATASLGLGPGDLMNDLPAFGLFFETMAVRDLRSYADTLRGSVFHYKDASGLECDAVVHLRNGAYGLVEIKLGGDRLIDSGAASLRRLAERIDTTNMKPPSFKMVLTATGDRAYSRTDGVFVCPIAALRP